MVAKQMHLLKIHPTLKSKAKLFRGSMKTEKFVGGEEYSFKLEFENIGNTDFPGGVGQIEAKCPPAGYSVFFNLHIPSIKKGKKVPLEEFVSDVPREGFTLFFPRKMDASDGAPVGIFDKNGKPRSENMSFAHIFAESRSEIYQYYMLIIAAVSLMVLVILSLFQIYLLYFR